MGRLYWKILGCFLVAAVISALLFGSQTSSQGQLAKLQHLQNQRLDALAIILQLGGPSAAIELLQKQQPLRPAIQLLDSQGTALYRAAKARLISASGEQLSRQVTAPDGNQYQLTSQLPSRLLIGTDARQPLLRLIAYSLISGLICAWLAWYLTRPIRLISKGAQALAKGQWQQPLTKQLGTRRDELTELAVEFDTMASTVLLQRQQLEEQQKKQRQLFNDISHELRTPLTRVRLRLALLERQHKLDNTDGEAFNQDIQRLEQLIDQLLTLARLDSPLNYPCQDYLSIGGFLSSLIEQNRQEAQQADCSVELEINSSDDTVLCNSELLRRGFENILRNCFKYAPSSPVHIQLKSLAGKQLAIVFRDFGPGISEQQLTEIFSPFSRLDNSSTQQGYGLGMAICRRAIEHHGGTISAANCQPGLAIHIALPLSKATE